MTIRGRRPDLAGVVIGIACGVTAFLLYRIATRGTFVDLQLNFAGAVTVSGVLIFFVDVALAVTMLTRSAPVLRWVAVPLGVATVPVSLALLAIGHESAAAVAGLGALIALVAGSSLAGLGRQAAGR
jgi:hypothetical protein